MRRKLISLMQKRKGFLDEAEKALELGNNAEFEAQMQEADKLKNEIDNINRLLAAQGDFDPQDSNMLHLHDIQQEQKVDKLNLSRVDKLRNDREYVTAWASAIRNGISPARSAGMENMKPLTNVLTISGGDPAGSDGGFLAPLDFDNLLHEKEKEYFDLSTLFSAETTTVMSGWRAIATTSAVALPQIDEGATIDKTAQPSFEKVSFTLKKYGDRLAVSRELLNAEPDVLMAYIARWFAQRDVLTKNTLLLALLDGLTGSAITAGAELKGIKSALNKGLNTAHARQAAILTNQSGYDAFDSLEDKNGRPLLVPNPADPDTYRLKGKPIHYMDDDLIPNKTTNAPLYIGSFKAFGTLFQRSGIEIASTDIGGDAWTTASPEIRALTFLDAQQVDAKAVVKRTYTVSE